MNWCCWRFLIFELFEVLVLQAIKTKLLIWISIMRVKSMLLVKCVIMLRKWNSEKMSFWIVDDVNFTMENEYSNFTDFSHARTIILASHLNKKCNFNFSDRFVTGSKRLQYTARECTIFTSFVVGFSGKKISSRCSSCPV